MYAGYVVEEAGVTDLFRSPAHPYTQGLLASIPRIDQDKEELSTIPGSVPHPSEVPTGCYFHPRCPMCMERCKQEAPRLRKVGERKVACHLVGSEEVRA